MDMSDMDMSMMMGSSGMEDNQWEGQNSHIARVLWYLIAAFVGVGLLCNIITHVQARRRIKVSSAGNDDATRPNNVLSQWHATFMAVCREASYPLPYIVHRFPKLNPPSMGRLIILATYWLVILCMLFVNSIISGAYYYEKIAFRAGWTSVTQVPFVFLLAGKNNIIGFLVGSSHERINWLHRWVARTLLITVTVHFAFFFREWYLADFVKLELQIMPMVKYGLISYGVLGWIVVSSFLPIRSLCYELFVVQHIISGCVFLWAVYTHVPTYARYNIYMAIGFYVFDRAVRSARLLYNNISLFHPGQKSKSLLTCSATLKALPGNVTRVTIPNVPFSWKPSQHVFLQLPSIAPFSSHPFTIASIPTSRSLEFVVRAHSGFSRSLYAQAVRQESKGESEPVSIPAIIDGPYGCPPAWSAFETLVLIAGSTGASFTVPVLQHVLASPACVRRIVFCWVVKRPEDISWYEADLSAAVEAFYAVKEARPPSPEADPEKSAAKNAVDDLSLDIRIFVSCGVDSTSLGDTKLLPSPTPAKAGACTCCCAPAPAPLSPIRSEKGAGDQIRPISSSSSSSSEEDNEPMECCCAKPVAEDPKQKLRYEQACYGIGFTSGRPRLYKLLDEALCEARGETAVGVCGPSAMNAEVRNAVATLSDDRAVHKGSGAQGVFLWSEGFGW